MEPPVDNFDFLPMRKFDNIPELERQCQRLRRQNDALGVALKNLRLMSERLQAEENRLLKELAELESSPEYQMDPETREMIDQVSEAFGKAIGEAADQMLVPMVQRLLRIE